MSEDSRAREQIAKLDREFASTENEKQRKWDAEEEEKRREFIAAENQKERDFLVKYPEL